MMILNSIPGRFLLAFYSLSLWVLAQHIKQQVKLLLEYNSTHWQIYFYHTDQQKWQKK